MFSKRAFTLAEVLITLGIIGVVSAMTIPTLIHSYQKRAMESVLKEDYSILQQVIKLNIADDVPLDPNIPDSIEGSKDWYERYIQGKMRVEQVCYDEAGCWHSKTFTKTLAGGTALSNRTGIGLGEGIILMRLPNGSSMCVDGFQDGHMRQYFGVDAISPGVVIYVDVNGDRNPNVIGKDIYVFAFTDEGFVPAGNDRSIDTCRSNCSASDKSRNAGYYCAARVKQNGWVIPDDVWRIKV